MKKVRRRPWQERHELSHQSNENTTRGKRSTWHALASVVRWKRRGACARPHVEVSCGDYRVYRASRHIKHASTVMAGSLYSKNVGVVLVCLCSLNCAMINKEIIQIGESIFGMIMKLCY